MMAPGSLFSAGCILKEGCLPPCVTPKVLAGHLKATQAIRKVLRQGEHSAPSAVAVGVLKGREGLWRGTREGYL